LNVNQLRSFGNKCSFGLNELQIRKTKSNINQ